MTGGRHSSGERSPARRLGLGAVAVAVSAGAALIALGFTHSDAAPRSLPHAFGPSASARGSAAPSVVVPPVAARPTGADGSSVPTRVRIGALHVRAPVVPVGSSGDGVLDIPKRPDTLGWWSSGAAPGAAIGTAVVVGHVDSARTGPGALFHLDEIRRGDRVDVDDAADRTVSFRVTALQIVSKTTGLRPALFASDGAPRLVLITCGGPFDRRAHSYEDNIVVVADRG